MVDVFASKFMTPTVRRFQGTQKENVLPFKKIRLDKILCLYVFWDGGSNYVIPSHLI